MPNPRQFILASKRVLLDPVTRLPDPALLLDRVEMALARARRDRGRVAVFVLYDVAGTEGPGIREVGDRLQSVVRPDDTVSRVAGRTFVVVCNHTDTDAAADTIGARLLDHVGRGCRMGRALGTAEDDARDLLAAAAYRAVGATPKAEPAAASVRTRHASRPPSGLVA